MKHKLLFGFATAAMAAVMCVGFAACGGVDAKSVKGEEVTAEQWEAALDALDAEDAKYTIEATSTSKSDKGNTESESTLVVNGAKTHYTYKSTMEVDGEKQTDEGDIYVEHKDGAYVVYEKGEDGKWTSEEERSNHYDYTTILGVVFGGYPAYDEYKYSADDKGYVLKDVAEGESSPVIKFDKDGKLVAVYFNGKLDMEFLVLETEVNVVIDYDAKDITLPTVG